MNKLYANINIQHVEANKFFVCSDNLKLNCYRRAHNIEALKATLRLEYKKYDITFLTAKH